MPPKLRKEKPTQGSKITPTRTTNQYEILSDNNQTRNPAKTTGEHTTASPTSNSTSNDQLAAMQNDLASMIHVIQTISSSMHKMDKLDKIDEIEARQKSSETIISDMVTDRRCEIELLKATTPTTMNPTYAEILQTSEDNNDNTETGNNDTSVLHTTKPVNKQSQY